MDGFIIQGSHPARSKRLAPLLNVDYVLGNLGSVYHQGKKLTKLIQ